MVLTDMLNAEDDDFFLIGEQLINGRGELMHRMRDVYLGADSALTNAERTNVLQITSNAEHIFSLLSELGAGVPGSCRQRAAERVTSGGAGGRGGAPSPAARERSELNAMASFAGLGGQRPEHATGARRKRHRLVARSIARAQRACEWA